MNVMQLLHYKTTVMHKQSAQTLLVLLIVLARRDLEEMVLLAMVRFKLLFFNGTVDFSVNICFNPVQLFQSDINECSENLDDCHANANCNNTFGSFSCWCKAGFAGDGVDSCQG